MINRQTCPFSEFCHGKWRFLMGFIRCFIWLIEITTSRRSPEPWNPVFFFIGKSSPWWAQHFRFVKYLNFFTQIYYPLVSIINMIINPIVIPTTKFLGNITHRIHVCYIWCAMDPINKKPIHVSIYTIHESMVIPGSELMEVR